MKCLICKVFAAAEGSIICEGCMETESDFVNRWAGECAAHYNGAYSVAFETLSAGDPDPERHRSAANKIALMAVNNFIDRIEQAA